MVGNVIFMYSYYKDSGEKAEEFYIMKTYVVTSMRKYEREESTFFPNLINQQDLKNASIEWFKKISGDDYRDINELKYWFVEIEISDDFNAAAITCPESGEWKVVPNLYPSNRP